MKPPSSKDATHPLRKAARESAFFLSTGAALPTARWRVLPDYLVIGAQRSGTTALHRVLERHPDIKSPRLMKGVHYFDTGYSHTDAWYRAHFHTAWFARLHERRTDEQLIAGEASPYYLYHPLVPERVHRLLPDVKLIALLRDPVERAISHHKHSIDRGNERLDLNDALAAEPDRLADASETFRRSPNAIHESHQNHSYAARGEYGPQIERWLQFFERSQLHVIESERYFSDPEPTLRRVLEFLGVRQWAPETFVKVNATESTQVDPAVRNRLRLGFEPSNELLAELVGERFSWM